MKKSLVLILMLLVVFCSYLQPAAARTSENVINSYNELEADFYKGKFTLVDLEKKLKKLTDDLVQSKNSYDKFYYLGKLNFLLGEISDLQNQEEKSINYYESAKKSVETALEYKKNSNIYNLIGKLYIRLLNKKGAFYAIRNGQKTFDLINKAVDLNNENYSAYNSLGIIYLQAPKIGGGDTAKSEKFFKKALKSDKEIDNFISYYYLAELYAKKENKNLKKDFREKAENIFPESYYLKNN